VACSIFSVVELVALECEYKSLAANVIASDFVNFPIVSFQTHQWKMVNDDMTWHPIVNYNSQEFHHRAKTGV
jgi:hypothetical protein